jgi:hypothetical protein
MMSLQTKAMGCNASSIDQSSTINDWSKYVVKCIIDFLNAYYSIVIVKIDVSLLLMCKSNHIVPINKQYPKQVTLLQNKFIWLENPIKKDPIWTSVKKTILSI